MKNDLEANPNLKKQYGSTKSVQPSSSTSLPDAKKSIAQQNPSSSSTTTIKKEEIKRKAEEPDIKIGKWQKIEAPK